METTRTTISATPSPTPSAIPPLDYLPRKPRDLHRPIGVIGAGGIAGVHLRNYRAMGLNVVAIADIDAGKADARRREFYPDASVYTDHRNLLEHPGIEVVDVTPHPEARIPIVEEALLAGKHVLSQKPFVLDLAEGRRLVELAGKQNVQLAVNQNGRWAPHFSYLRNAVAAGLIGQIVSADFLVHWNHTWIKGLPAFEDLRHVILYDFSIHWFDILCVLMEGQTASQVYASVRGFPLQKFRPPSQASVIIDYESAQARMGFNAHTSLGAEDVTIIAGTAGTLRTYGGCSPHSRVEVFTPEGEASFSLNGEWFTNGFQGTMGEMLCAIEEGREPSISARNNLTSLELCFAALASADTGLAVVPGSVSHVGQP